MFRDDFVWGVASSAYQVEGRDPEDGCGKNIWDTLPKREGSWMARCSIPAVTTCTDIKRIIS